MLIRNMQSDFIFRKNSSLYLRFQMVFFKILDYNQINFEIKILRSRGSNLLTFMLNHFYNKLSCIHA